MRLIGSPTEVGEPQHGEEPADDSDFTWHVHDIDPAYRSPTWGTGIVCTYCQAPPKVHGGGKKVNFNITRLKNTNELGQTQNELRRDIYENARRDGRDITRA